MQSLTASSDGGEGLERPLSVASDCSIAGPSTPAVQSSETKNVCASDNINISCQKRKLGDSNSSKTLINAALERIACPRVQEDQFTVFGKLIGIQLKNITEDDLQQGKLAQKIINDTLFLASMKQLTIDSQIVTVARGEQWNV